MFSACRLSLSTLLFACLYWPALNSSATPLPEYTILRSAGPIAIDGLLDEPSWQYNQPVHPFIFPWWQEGEKEPTYARLLWDDSNLYISFIAFDKNISATLTERDSPVSRDDCVEVFFAPDPGAVDIYFNFEFNALGAILDRSPREQRSSKWNGQGVQVAVQIDGTLNDESDSDRQWNTEIAIPWTAIAPYAPSLPPLPGQSWRLNLYRIGGQINPQYSVWSDTETPKPQYHAPARFGIGVFSEAEVPVPQRKKE